MDVLTNSPPHEFEARWKFGNDHGGNYGKTGTLVVAARTVAEAMAEVKKKACHALKIHTYLGRYVSVEEIHELSS